MIFLKKSTKAGFILSLLLPLVFGLLSAHARVLDKVAAKVNSEIITLSAIEERAVILGQKYVGAPVSISEQDLLKKALNMIIEEKLQIQEGKKYGCDGVLPFGSNSPSNKLFMLAKTAGYSLAVIGRFSGITTRHFSHSSECE